MQGIVLLFEVCWWVMNLRKKCGSCVCLGPLPARGTPGCCNDEHGPSLKVESRVLLNSEKIFGLDLMMI